MCVKYATLRQEVSYMKARIDSVEGSVDKIIENQWNPKVVAALVALCGTVCTTAGAVLSVYLQKVL